MNHNQEPALAGSSHDYETILVILAIRIWNCGRQWVAKDSARLGKSDAMLTPVRKFFSRIPLEAQWLHPPLSLANSAELRAYGFGE